MAYSKDELSNPHLLLHQLSELKLKIGIAQSLIFDKKTENKSKVISHLVDIFHDMINMQPRMYDLDIEANYVGNQRLL